jgi:hypothetical protein
VFGGDHFSDTTVVSESNQRGILMDIQSDLLFNLIMRSSPSPVVVRTPATALRLCSSPGNTLKGRAHFIFPLLEHAAIMSGQRKMKPFLFGAIVWLALLGWRAEDRDYVICRESTFGDTPTQLVKPEDALAAKNGARLEIEKKLTAAASEYEKKSLRFILDNWDHYICQVIGTRNASTDVFLLRFFPREMQKDYDFTSTSVGVKDGGPRFWRIEYNLNTQTYSSLQINGEA